MNPKLNKALKITSSALATIVVVFAILLVGVKLVGIEVYTILSPSMESTYPTGSLIYLVDADPAELKEGDVITFRVTDSMTATHRIVELVPDESNPGIFRFRTKGDNNKTVDGSLVEYDEVIGKPVFCIPLLGYLAQYIQHPPGSTVAITVSIAMILFVVIVDILIDDKDKKKFANKDELHKGVSKNEKI